MGDETWASIQLVKSKHESFREKLKKRKAVRKTVLSGTRGDSITTSISTSSGLYEESVFAICDPHIEVTLLEVLNEQVMVPVHISQLIDKAASKINQVVNQSLIDAVLKKFVYKEFILLSENDKEGRTDISFVDHDKIAAFLEAEQSTKAALDSDGIPSAGHQNSLQQTSDGKEVYSEKRKLSDTEDDVMSLLLAQSIMERETKKVGNEIMELLSKPTAKEQLLTERFRSQGGKKVKEFCQHGTKDECFKINRGMKCGKLHFQKIIQKHTDESLGDCSFLNTCFHMDTCRYVHYEVDSGGQQNQEDSSMAELSNRPRIEERTILFPPQWIQCDLRYLDMSILGKFAVIMADPPWDIHMELPYGTMSDVEMKQINIPVLQDDGLLFLWVTGRAMEHGRECLAIWGYERVDEIIWVKTNQLQRIIRTGRTGHWLNHGKEHCLVGMKGNPKINRWLDADVIVAEVRATSHKPDEIYGIIERLSPGTRKLELFGRMHNVQPNCYEVLCKFVGTHVANEPDEVLFSMFWGRLTLGNQLDGIHILEEDLNKRFYDYYPDGICRKPEIL